MRQLFRECMSAPQSMYQKVEEKDLSIKAQESLKSLPNKLEESSNVNALIKEAQKLKESADDKAVFDKVINKLKTSGAGQERKLWKFPVSRFGNRNGNGRIYPRQLWENVIENQRDAWYGGVGLADHPREDDDPGEFKTSSIVWLDMMIDDANKLIWAIGSFVGTYGRLAQEIIEAGGRVGFSSSGFGELMGDGMTINPDTYQIERVADIVTNPSQSVFGDIGNAHEDTNIEYSKQQKTSESLDYAKILKDALREGAPKSQIIQGKNNMTANAVQPNTQAQAQNNNGQQAAPVQPAQNTQPAQQAAPANNAQPAQNANAQAQQPVQESTRLSKVEKQIITKYVENLSSEAEKIKNPSARLKELNKILEMVEESEDEELQEMTEAKLTSAKEELEAMVEKALDLGETFGGLDNLSENIKDVAIQGKLLNEQVNDYEKLSKALTERNRKLYKENQILKSKLALKERAIESKNLKANKSYVVNAEMNDAIMKTKSRLNKVLEINQRLNKGNRKLEAQNGSLKTKLSEATLASRNMKETGMKSMKEAEALSKENESLKAQITRLQDKNKQLNEAMIAKNNEFEAYKEDQKIENKILPSPTELVGSQLNFREKKGLEVESYWKDLCNQYGESAMKPFESQIRGAKTYREAFNNFMKNISLIDSDSMDYTNAKLSENIINQKDRKEYLAESGITLNTGYDSGMSAEEINKIEYQKMLAQGFI